MSYITTNLCGADKRRFVQKIKDFTENECEISFLKYHVPDNEWIDDISLWPPVEFGSIYSYLTERPVVFTKEKLKAYKSLDAYNYYSR